MNPEMVGKKVFFINPHSVIQNKLIQDLIEREYEVYFINDHRKVESICEYYTAPIIFINIDEGLEEAEWEKQIRSLMEKESTRHAMLGIVTYNESSVLAQKYLMDIMVPCGFIKLKLGLEASTKIIVKTLEANEVKGKRKFVRAQCEPGEAGFNTSILGNIYNGQIVDISSVGMAVAFDDNIELAKNSYLPDIQLKLRGILVSISGVVIGYRKQEEDKTLYLILFDYKNAYNVKFKIRSFISRTLQNKMERKLKIG